MELLKILWDGENGVNVIINPNVLEKLNDDAKNKIPEDVRKLFETIQNGLK